MSKLLLCLVFVVPIVILKCDGYQMTRCQLVKELRKHRFPEKYLRDWVCLVENESSRITDIISHYNTNGSRDYGLFQINDKYWCSNTGSPGKDCNVACDDLILDDITKAAKCAKKIYRVQGFIAWHGWQRKCQGELPDISECGRKTKKTKKTVISG